MKIAVCVAIVLAITAAATSAPAARPAALGVQDSSNANASIAAVGQFVAIAWGATKDGSTGVYAAVSRDGGMTFSSPVAVSDSAQNVSLSGEQPPRVALVPRSAEAPSIVVVWTTKTTAGTRLAYAQSDDGGTSFANRRIVRDSEATGNRGWEATASDPNGDVLAIWLDHREQAHDHASHHAQGSDGAARAQLSKLYFARVNDATPAVAVTGGVCYCCKTAIAVGHDRSIYAAWRHVYPGNLRDIAFTVSRDGGRTFDAPLRVSDDRWVLDGCPENGPAMVVDQRGRIHVVWPTLVPGGPAASEPSLSLFYASSDDGRRFTPRQQIPTEGVPRHAQIAIDAGGAVVVTWDEQAAGSRRVMLARGVAEGGGVVRFSPRALSDADRGSYPVVAATDTGTIVAWTSGTAGATVLQTLRLAN